MGSIEGLLFLKAEADLGLLQHPRWSAFIYIYIYSIVNFEHVIDGWEYPVKSIKIVKGKVLFMESFLTGETILPRRQKHIELYSKHFLTAEKFRFPLFCL